MKRLFVAIDLNAEVLRRVSEAQGKLTGRAHDLSVDVNWIPGQNFHITILFLGETHEALIPRLMTELSKAAREIAAFPIGLKGVGGFPRVKNARVLWVGVQDPRRELAALAQNVSNSLKRETFVHEKKVFSPHLTLGRVRRGRRTQELLDPWLETDFGVFEVREIVLYESVLSNKGAQYSVLGRWPFNRIS